MHLYGLMNLSQIAVYIPSQSSARRERRLENHRHHRHFHKRRRRLEALGSIEIEAEKWEVEDLIVVTIDGKAVTWITYDETLATSEVTMAAVTSQVVSNTYDETSATATNFSDAAATTSSTAPSWDRIAYYSSAAPAQATGLAFLNSKGNDVVSRAFDT